MVDTLRDELLWFAREQREDFAMVVAAEDGDLPMVLSFLEGFDEADPERVYLTFAHEARTPRAYLDVMLELVRMRVPMLDALRAQRGAPPFPPMPETLLDGDRPAHERFIAMLEWWRSGLRDPAQIVVVALLPSAFPSIDTYRDLVWRLLPHGGLEPWMRHTRLIVRDSREAPFLTTRLAGIETEGVVQVTANFSPEACEEGLAADVANRDLGARARGLAAVQLAAMDFAYGRHAQALDKYGSLANLFMDLEDEPSTALCLVGAGDVHRQRGELLEARERYGQAIELAARADAKPVLLNAMIGLAGAAGDAKEYRAAEIAWDGAARVAGAMGMEHPVADFVEQVGVARREQGCLSEAWVVWERALEYLAEPERIGPYPEREISVLERMVALADQERWSELERDARRRLGVAQRKYGRVR